MKKLIIAIAVSVFFIVGCASHKETVVPSQSLSALGSHMNEVMQTSIAYRNAGKYGDEHWMRLVEKYNAFRYQIDQESQAAQMNFFAPASEKLSRLAEDFLNEAKP